MKHLDKLIVPPCTVQTANNPADCTKPPGSGDGDGGVVVEPPVECEDFDVCCADPAFAAEHPEECAHRVRLIIKPEYVSKPVLEAVQYSTFLVNSLGQETELTAGLEYSVSDNLIAVIGSASGNLTTLAEGVATVRVKWQNLSAQAQLNVVAECGDSSVGMMLVIDNSKSMNRKFSDDYATLLSYAKTLARRFVGELNTTKDKMGLVCFADVGKLVRELTNDTETLKADIQTLPSSQSKTDIHEGLKTAIDHLATQTVDRKVLVLFTDGAKNDGEDPLPLAQSFKDGGGIIVVVGTRAHGSGFSLLQKLSTTGFLLNSYDSTNDDENSDYLSGLKGYFCAGNCVPEGDVYQSHGELSYKGFKEWDVDGDVDLIGKGAPSGQQFYDLLPGNGLYVDLAGSGPPWKGTLVSKRTFKLETAIVYRLQLKLAGNQRLNASPYTVRVTVGDLLSEDIEITDWQQPFTTYSYDITGDGSEGNKIKIELIDTPGVGTEPFGPLLDLVRFDRITATAALLLFDDFDGENEQYIVPGCGEPPEPPAEGHQLINIKVTGPTWIPRSFRTGSWYSSAMKDDGGIIYAGEWGGKIVKSDDFGVTWAETTAPSYFWRGMACSNDGTVVFGSGTPGSFSGTSNVQVYTSTDSGGTWTARSVETGYGWNACACDSTGAKLVVVAMPSSGAGQGYLYTSTNTGANWTRRDTAGTKGFTGVAMSADGNTIVAASLAGPGLVVISTDAGATWTEKPIGPAGFLRDIRMTGDAGAIVACDDAFIYRSLDGGNNWTMIIPYVYGNEDTDFQYPWVRLSISDDGLKIMASAVDQVTTTGRKDSVLAITVDGGFSWRRSFLGHEYWMVGMARDGSLAIAGASFEQLVLAASDALDADNVKVGPAVVNSGLGGGGSGDYWNEWPGETPSQTTVVPEPMFYADGTIIPGDPDLLMSQMVGGYDWGSEVVGTQLDPLMRRYLKTANFTAPGDWKQCEAFTYFGTSANGCRYMKISGIPEGNWDFYIYGHGDANNENSRFRLTTDFVDSVSDQTAEGSGMAGTWLAGLHYIVFEKIKVNKDEPVYLFILPPSGNSGGIQYNVLQGLQIKWVQPPTVPIEVEGCYGTGCLDEPPPEQKPDPNPLPDIE